MTSTQEERTARVASFLWYRRQNGAISPFSPIETKQVGEDTYLVSVVDNYNVRNKKELTLTSKSLELFTEFLKEEQGIFMNEYLAASVDWKYFNLSEDEIKKRINPARYLKEKQEREQREEELRIEKELFLKQNSLEGEYLIPDEISEMFGIVRKRPVSE